MPHFPTLHSPRTSPEDDSAFPYSFPASRRSSLSDSPSSDREMSLHDAEEADIEDTGSSLRAQTLNADGTPKRPMNAFMIFARRRRPQVSAENTNMRTGEISKILSKEWQEMDSSAKQWYLNQAKILKDTFNSRYPDYVYRRRPNNSRKRRRTLDSPYASPHRLYPEMDIDPNMDYAYGPHSHPDMLTSMQPMDGHYPGHDASREYGLGLSIGPHPVGASTYRELRSMSFTSPFNPSSGLSDLDSRVGRYRSGSTSEASTSSSSSYMDVYDVPASHPDQVRPRSFYSDGHSQFHPSHHSSPRPHTRHGHQLRMAISQPHISTEGYASISNATASSSSSIGDSTTTPTAQSSVSSWATGGTANGSVHHHHLLSPSTGGVLGSDRDILPSITTSRLGRVRSSSESYSPSYHLSSSSPVTLPPPGFSATSAEESGQGHTWASSAAFMDTATNHSVRQPYQIQNPSPSQELEPRSASIEGVKASDPNAVGVNVNGWMPSGHHGTGMELMSPRVM